MELALSPYARKMGFAVRRDADGRLLIEMPYGTKVAGRPGFVHGGALAGLLETVAYATLHEALGDDDRPRIKPINLTVSYMRGAREKTTIARATIERLGKRIANVEAIAWQEDEERPVAMAQLNILLARA